MEDRGEAAFSGSSTVSQPLNPHQLLLLGTMFGLIGGVMVLSSSFLSWVSEMPFPFMPEGLVVEWYINDLITVDDLYLWLYLIPLTGALVIALSVLSLVTEGGQLHRFSAVGCLAAAAVAIIILGIVLVWLTDHFVESPGRDALFGPAPYICVFGGVLGLAGGWMQLQASLSSRGFFTWKRKAAFRERMYWEEPPAVGERCPGCLSAVSPDMDRCPACGREL